jgi:hypothetical protein
MKKTIILIASLVMIMLCACRSKKHLESSKVDSTTVSSTSKQHYLEETHIDTGKKVDIKSSELNQIIITVDSTYSKTTITPIPGTQSIVDPDGTFHGQAKSITHEQKRGKNKMQKTNKKAQQNTGDFKGVSDKKTNDSLSTTKDSTEVDKSHLKEDKKPSYGPWPWVCGLVVVICLFVVLLWFFGRPKKK